jgi:hypothetical protein
MPVQMASGNEIDATNTYGFEPKRSLSGNHENTVVIPSKSRGSNNNTGLEIKSRDGLYIIYVAADGSGSGENESDPASLDYAKANVTPGGAVYLLAGNYGEVTIDASDAVGTENNWITYISWPNFHEAGFTSLSYSGPKRSAYLKFCGIYIDPGYTPEAKHAVNLHYVDDVEFDSCRFEGAKVAGVEINNGGFAPYSFTNDAIIYTHYTMSGNPSNISIKNCEFLYGYNAIRINSGTNWTIMDNTIAEFSDNGIQISAGFGDNTQIKNNEIHHGNTFRCSFYWPGTATGIWSDKRWQTVTQDNTGASGIFYEMSDRFYIYADDPQHTPIRSTTDIWRLDSDPNIYFTPSGTGDNAHTDLISIEGTADNVVIDSNYLYETTGQAIKVGSSGGEASNILFINNVIFDSAAGTYLILLEVGNGIMFYNNLIDAGDAHPLRGIRPLGSTLQLELYNNIISGAIYSNGTITSDYNVWATTPPAQYNEGEHSLLNQNFNSGMFMNRIAGDYRLVKESPAIDKANVAYAPSIDVSGNVRDNHPDIGAYEYINAVPLGVFYLLLF